MRPSAEARLREVRSFPDRLARYRQEYTAWQANWHCEDPATDKEKYAFPDADLTNWRLVEVVGSFTDPALTNGGVLWLRRTIDVP